MTSQLTRTAATPQLIPTNEGGRSFAAPPRALQRAVTPNDLFYVRNHWKGAPQLDSATYRLAIDGAVERSLSLDYQALRSMPRKHFEVTMECCGNSPVPEYWAKVTRVTSSMEQVKGHGIMGNAEWAGVSLAHVLRLAGVKASAVEAMFEGADHGPDEQAADPPDVTYARSLPLAKALHPDTLLAYEMNGETLPALHGYPVRLVVPGWYGMCSIKWLVAVHVLDHKFEGFYQTKRYRSVNDPQSEDYYTYHTSMKVKSIITDPAPGEYIPAAGCRLAGAAWSGEDEVAKVEVSTDGGASWHQAIITRPRSGYSWCRWAYDWLPPHPGQYTLMSRATNTRGETQPVEFPNQWDGLGYGNNMIFALDVEVREG